MAFPGERITQKQIEIAASMVTGALNHDFALILTEANFAEDDLTLGGANALQASSLTASRDDSGQYQYCMGTIRIDLNATWTLSRVEIVVCVPAEEISTLDNAQVWLWWNSAADVAPAANEDFGLNDVFNGVTDSTGGRSPLVTRCAVMFDALPSDPAPQYPDISGSGQHVTCSDPDSNSRVDLIPGRGLQGQVGTTLTPGSFDPGLGPWSVIECTPPAGEYSNSFFASDNWNFGPTPGFSRFSIAPGIDISIPTGATGVRVMSMTRDGDNMLCVSDELFGTRTGAAAIDFDTVTAIQVRRGNGDVSISLAYFLYCAPNLNWHILHYRVIHNVEGTIISHPSNVVGVTGAWTSIDFVDLLAGSEVRVYESPHAAKWSLDLSGATSADIGVDYVDFDIVTSTTTDRHYIWWTTDPGMAGATGHQVVRVGGETDEELAALACTVIDGLSDISATVDGAVIAVENARIGLTVKPVYHGLEGAVTVAQIGGTLETEIGGIETSTGTSFSIPVLVDSSRRISVAMMSDDTEIVQFLATLTRGTLIVNARPLQRKDYAND